MRDTKIIRTVAVEDINERVYRDPDLFVEECEKDYLSQIDKISEEIVSGTKKVIFLAGPSASGKTTTAHILKDCIEKHGKHAMVVSLDDFYRGQGNVPVLEDGTEDYESVYALNIEMINRCMDELYLYGTSQFPIFDFSKNAPSDKKRTVTTGADSILIVEGIHALNPVMHNNLYGDNILKIYVSVNTQFTHRERVIYTPRTARYVRRLIRDYNFRGQPIERTAEMWENVCNGEEKYIRPFKDSADMWIDSTIVYEACVFHHFLYSVLDENKYEYIPEIQKLYDLFDYFDDIDERKIPEKSLLREFIL